MSQFISELIDAEEPHFTMAVRDLEKASSHSSTDIKLISDIIRHVHQKSKELGLDPKDTTGKELYHALHGLAKLHDGFLIKAIGGSDEEDINNLLPKLLRAINALPLERKVWVLKTSEAKKMLKKMPPKKVMKQLHYRSVDSMLKHENVHELFLALRILETEAWQDKFVKAYKALSSKHFEIRDIQILLLDIKKWGAAIELYVRTHKHNIIHSKEMGCIGVLPFPVTHLPGATLSDAALIVHYINELRIYSSYFKYHQVKPDFGDILATTLHKDEPTQFSVAGRPIHWRILHRRYGKNPNQFAEVFEPHVQAEDMQWHSPGNVLFRLEPALIFWNDIDYVGVVHDQKPISFNIIDAAINYCNNLPYGYHIASNMQSALSNELHARYIEQQPLEDELMGQLDERYNFDQQITVLEGRK